MTKGNLNKAKNADGHQVKPYNPPISDEEGNFVNPFNPVGQPMKLPPLGKLQLPSVNNQPTNKFDPINPFGSP